MAALQARFLARCAVDLDRLRTIVDEGRLDDDEAKALAHSLSGAGATFGFPDISRAAGRLDDAYADGLTPSEAEVRTLVAALEAAVKPAS
jgi:HPt (histidine-containing phosphotransfer) domain-containing protein